MLGTLVNGHGGSNWKWYRIHQRHWRIRENGKIEPNNDRYILSALCSSSTKTIMKIASASGHRFAYWTNKKMMNEVTIFSAVSEIQLFLTVTQQITNSFKTQSTLESVESRNSVSPKTPSSSLNIVLTDEDEIKVEKRSRKNDRLKRSQVSLAFFLKVWTWHVFIFVRQLRPRPQRKMYWAVNSLVACQTFQLIKTLVRSNRDWLEILKFYSELRENRSESIASIASFTESEFASGSPSPVDKVLYFI